MHYIVCVSCESVHVVRQVCLLWSVALSVLIQTDNSGSLPDQGRWGSGQRSGAPSCPCCSTDGEAAGLHLLQRSHWASGPVPCPGAILHGLNWSPKQHALITNLTFSWCFLSRQTYTLSQQIQAWFVCSHWKLKSCAVVRDAHIWFRVFSTLPLKSFKYSKMLKYYYNFK